MWLSVAMLLAFVSKWTLRPYKVTPVWLWEVVWICEIENDCIDLYVGYCDVRIGSKVVSIDSIDAMRSS